MHDGCAGGLFHSRVRLENVWSQVTAWRTVWAMGLFTSGAKTLGSDAAEARRTGMPVFVASLHSSALLKTTGAMPDWSERIAEVEASGWRLDQMTAASTQGNIWAFCTFRPI